jgi:hypothetical protein
MRPPVIQQVAKRGALTMAEAMKKMDLWHRPHGFIVRGGTVIAVALGDDRVTIADRIIRAVNAHEALVKACGEYLIDHDVAAISRAEGPKCFCDRCEATRAALTLAKG